MHIYALKNVILGTAKNTEPIECMKSIIFCSKILVSQHIELMR